MKRFTTAAVLLVSTVVVIGLLYLVFGANFSPPDEGKESEGEAPATGNLDRRAAPSSGAKRTGAPGASSGKTAEGKMKQNAAILEGARSPSTGSEQPRTARLPSDREGWDAGNLEPVGRSHDAGIDAARYRDWKDPVNRRVLGDKRWMAPTPPELKKEIEEVFDRPKPVDPRIDRFDRQASVDAARTVVDACYEELLVARPDARGRISLAWEAWAASGTGHIQDPRITANLYLRFPEFEACVLDSLDGLSFPTDGEGEARTVEYPFFYED